ncbi:MAG: ATP-binding cassette domain-containing protein [Thermoanaerobaculia bacterium]
MNDSTPAIDVRGVTKSYDTFVAVNDVSFHVRPGTVFGLLGPNGAGKTTTIRMIMNITMPDSGEIRILGQPSTEVASRLIGYLPEERGLYRKMKVMDHLVFLGEIRGLDRATAKKRSLEWLEKFDLGEWQNKKVEELSKGMQQKIQFIGCAIHEPEVLILDEPFSGLDPVNTRILKETLLEYRDRGKTVILSTHVMEQAEKICDEIALINRSRLVLEGAIADIKRRFSGNRLVIRGEGQGSALEGLEGLVAVRQEDGQLEIDLVPGYRVSAFLRQAASRYEIESVARYEMSLDEIFVRAVSGDPVHAAAMEGRA